MSTDPIMANVLAINGSAANSASAASPVVPSCIATSPSPLRRLLLPALPDKVLPQLLCVEPQHPPAVAHLDPAIPRDVGIRHLHPLGLAGFPGAGNADNLQPLRRPKPALPYWPSPPTRHCLAFQGLMLDNG